MGAMESAITAAQRAGQTMASSRWVGFELASQAFALRIGCVREVVLSAHVDPVPGAPPLVLGVAALRGRIVSVLDLHGRLQIEPPLRSAASAGQCLIVVESAGEPLALRVDRIGQLYSLESERIKASPRVAAPGVDGAVGGHVVFESSLLTLLDLDALVDPIAMG